MASLYFTRTVSGGRRAALIVVLSVVAMGLSVPHAAAQRGDGKNAFSEYQIKAGFLLNFLLFIEYPPEVVEGKTLQIAIIGNGPFAHVLRAAEEYKKGHYKVTVRRFADIAAFDAAKTKCHLAYLAIDDPTRMKAAIEALSGKVITVSDKPGFIDQGGTIGFIDIPDKTGTKKRVGFEINLEPARAIGKKGLKISSQLLKLAKRVIGRKP
jgi:hypothetical protein